MRWRLTYELPLPLLGGLWQQGMHELVIHGGYGNWSARSVMLENKECPPCDAGEQGMPALWCWRTMTARLVMLEQCESAVGETVPSVGAGTRLRLRAKCSGSNIGRRSPWGPATRKGCPGVESSTAPKKPLLHLLLCLQKHKMLPVFPGRSLDAGCDRTFFGAVKLVVQGPVNQLPVQILVVVATTQVGTLKSEVD